MRWLTSVHFTPSELISVRWPASSTGSGAVLMPLTVRPVALVMKSVALSPVSGVMPMMASCVSVELLTDSGNGPLVAPVLPASSSTLAS
ncbi:hypothetical protein [Ramlibacter albus]|uniref:Uncharacterized protein n=1 Tax=Ramlibacter albus TaxID=2079448 RepID=A0A923MCZ7_9BURK|nr:hypothetical protein [Ramlibacter albus]MBC5768420.1 hypothetical protein [Ramlibacter albus]